MLGKCIGLIGLAVLIVPTATAQRGTALGQNSTWTLLAGKYDKNKDGKISAEEYTRGADKFGRFDRNSDGVLTQDDFGGGGRRGGRRDGRRGGRGTSPEQMAGTILKRLMASKVDSNADGKTTVKEWRTFLKSIANEAGVVDVAKLQSNRSGRGNRGGQDISALFDKDQDGDVTTQELSPWFSKLDSNKDGVLAGEETRSNRGGRGNRANLPKQGDIAPDFILPYVSSAKKMVKLSSFAGKKPVALIFGSYTWPPFRNAAGQLRQLYETYSNDVQFLLVYIKEAHAIDSRRPGRGGPIVEDPITDLERQAVAQICVTKLKLKMIPAIMDLVDNKVNLAYGAQPDRLYLVGKDGKIAFAGGQGPRGFRPNELENAIESELARIGSLRGVMKKEK